MSTVAFFGHSDYDYAPYGDKIKKFLTELIEAHGAVQFLNGFRGNFDCLCAKIVGELKQNYPLIQNILVLAYHPRGEEWMPAFFDGSVYLLEKRVMPKYAISYTNRAIVEHADCIVSGVKRDWGGAWTACARRKGKRIYNIFSDEGVDLFPQVPVDGGDAVRR